MYMMYRLDDSKIMGRYDIEKEFENLQASVSYQFFELREEIEKLKFQIKKKSRKNNGKRLK